MNLNRRNFWAIATAFVLGATLVSLSPWRNQIPGLAYAAGTAASPLTCYSFDQKDRTTRVKDLPIVTEFGNHELDYEGPALYCVPTDAGLGFQDAGSLCCYRVRSLPLKPSAGVTLMPQNVLANGQNADVRLRKPKFVCGPCEHNSIP